MTIRSRSIALAGIVAVLLGLGAAAIRVTEPDVCGGVGREIGGCDTSQPAFHATDCTGVATEFGTQLNDQVKAIVAGPDAVNSESRGVRINHMWTVAITRANQHLKGNKIPCDGTSFMATAAAQVGTEVKDGVAATMYAGRPGSYNEWIAEVTRVCTAIIDDPVGT